jgi:L-aminopeptidase/D-esterase-like protein
MLCNPGAVCGLDVRGGASGLRNPTVAAPGHLVERIHAVFLAGGSAFGLDAGAGVMRYLESHGVGFPVRGHRVPIVTGAILFDLGVGDRGRRPDPALAERACRVATRRPVVEGNVGAGTGATVGKLFGISRAMRGGLGSASARSGGVRVGALAVVNAFGDIRDPETNRLVAGARDAPDGVRIVGAESEIRRGIRPGGAAADSTTLGVVATDALLTREQACRLAGAAQVALARCLSPAHTLYDGDLVFALSTGRRKADPTQVEALAVEALTRAILRGVRAARGLPGLPAMRDLPGAGSGNQNA